MIETIISSLGPAAISVIISAIVAYFSAQKHTETKLAVLSSKVDDCDREITRLRDDTFRSLDVRLRAIEVHLSALESLIRAKG